MFIEPFYFNRCNSDTFSFLFLHHKGQSTASFDKVSNTIVDCRNYRIQQCLIIRCTVNNLLLTDSRSNKYNSKMEDTRRIHTTYISILSQ